MATISNIKGAIEPLLMSRGVDLARPKGDVESDRAPVDEKVINEILGSSQSSTNALEAMNSQTIQKMADQLQASLDRVSNNQHQVSFHHDPRIDNFIIEIKNVDGSVIKKFPPEKVLNLMQRLDDLSGMVIDTMI